jgi:hypothetical protein
MNDASYTKLFGLSLPVVLPLALALNPIALSNASQQLAKSQSDLRAGDSVGPRR